jgi:AraC-like DNA-binding protein
MHKPIALRYFLLSYEDMVGPTDHILADSGTSYEAIRELVPLSAETIGDLLDKLARRAPESFAIDCALATRARHLGFVGYAMANSPTVREAFLTWLKYSRVAGNPLVGSLREGAERWTYDVVPRFPMTGAALRFCVEAAIFGVAPVIEELTGKKMAGLQYSLSFAKPAHLRHDELGAVNIRFNQPRNQLTGLMKDMAMPTSFTDPSARQMLDQQCAHELARLEGTETYTERLTELFTAQPGHPPHIDEAAATLGLSARSLHRRLTDEGSNYNEVLDNFRRTYAFNQIIDGRIDVKKTAHILGFKNIGSFRRAFRRWTGTPLKHWLRENQTQPAAPSQ